LSDELVSVSFLASQRHEQGVPLHAP